ncbi:MAG: hypothetical protein KC652_25290 [Cyanobacteria bacterium HKST-UBA01]|nr:hypothetical protein [Cyanobacteria bacterium HKST-UBA01]
MDFVQDKTPPAQIRKIETSLQSKRTLLAAKPVGKSKAPDLDPIALTSFKIIRSIQLPYGWHLKRPSKVLTRGFYDRRLYPLAVNEGAVNLSLMIEDCSGKGASGLTWTAEDRRTLFQSEDRDLTEAEIAKLPRLFYPYVISGQGKVEVVLARKYRFKGRPALLLEAKVQEPKSEKARLRMLVFEAGDSEFIKVGYYAREAHYQKYLSAAQKSIDSLRFID